MASVYDLKISGWDSLNEMGGVNRGFSIWYLYMAIEISPVAVLLDPL